MSLSIDFIEKVFVSKNFVLPLNCGQSSSSGSTINGKSIKHFVNECLLKVYCHKTQTKLTRSVLNTTDTVFVNNLITWLPQNLNKQKNNAGRQPGFVFIGFLVHLTILLSLYL